MLEEDLGDLFVVHPRDERTRVDKGVERIFALSDVHQEALRRPPWARASTARRVPPPALALHLVRDDVGGAEVVEDPGGKNKVYWNSR